MKNPNESHTLYRYWKGDLLLYVGISVNAYWRASQHRRDSTWWPEADRMTMEHGFLSREAVLQAEMAAILSEHPLHNKVQNTDGSSVAAGRIRLNLSWKATAPMPKRPHHWIGHSFQSVLVLQTGQTWVETSRLAEWWSLREYDVADWAVAEGLTMFELPAKDHGCGLPLGHLHRWLHAWELRDAWSGRGFKSRIEAHAAG